MVLFLLRRLAAGVLVVLATAVLAFGGWRVVRGDDLFAGQPLVSSTIEEIKSALLPSRPQSLIHMDGLWADVWMLLGTLGFGMVAGTAAGGWCAANPTTLRARALESGAMLLFCMPPFVAGYGLLLLVDQRFGVVHVPFFFDFSTYAEPWENPWDWFRTMLAPWIVAGLPVAAVCLRIARSATSEAAGEEWMRTAAAKGLPDARVWRRHARPVAYPNVLSYISTSTSALLLNIAITETIFSVPGLLGGVRAAIGDSGGNVSTGEYNILALQMIGVWMAVLVVVIGIATDIAIARRDPRIRSAGQIG